MNAPRLTTDDTIALYRVLRHAPPAEIFRSMVVFFDSWHAVLEHQKHHERAAECALARNGCAFIASQLSELATANDAASAELIDQLQRSLRSA